MGDGVTLSIRVGMGSADELLQLTVPGPSTIKDVKTRLETLSGTPVYYQQLMADTAEARKLCDEETVKVVPTELVLLREIPEKDSLRRCCLDEPPFSEMDCPGERLLSYILEHGVDDPNIMVPVSEEGENDSNEIDYGAGSYSFLHILVKRGSLEMCRALLGSPRFTSVDAKSEMRELYRCYAEFQYKDATALHLAAATDQANICKLLLEDKRVGINSKCRKGYPALHFAVAQRSLACCQALLECDDYDVDAVDDMGKSSVEVAIACCYPEAEKYDLHELTEDGECWSENWNISCRDQADSVCDLLVKNGRCKVDAELLQRFEYTKRELEKDRARQMEKFSLTVRYPNGEVACSVDVCWGDTFSDLMGLMTAKMEAQGYGELANCFLINGAIYGGFVSERPLRYVFDGQCSSYDIRLIPMSNFRDVSPDNSAKLEFSNPEKFGCLTVTEVVSGALIWKDECLPYDSGCGVLSCKFHQEQRWIVFENAPSKSVDFYYFDLQGGGYFKMDGGERVAVQD